MSSIRVVVISQGCTAVLDVAQIAKVTVEPSDDKEFPYKSMVYAESGKIVFETNWIEVEQAYEACAIITKALADFHAGVVEAEEVKTQ